MTFLARATIILVLLVSSGSFFDLKSQIRAEKKATSATISGRVTIKGKGAPGIVVAVVPVSSANRSRMSVGPGYHATTDQEGNYRVTDVPTGSYRANPDAPAFVISAQPSGTTLIVNEGDSINDVDFALVKGGVITGRVTNSEGQPLIERQVTLMPVETNNQNSAYVEIVHNSWQTDDRGVYRMFGVSQGKYRVVVEGEENSFGGRTTTQTRQTFYPDVTDASKGATLEVVEGGELTGVDIVVETTEPATKFAVNGRIVDGATGQPVPNLRLGLQFFSGTQINYIGGPDYISDQNGRFKIDNLAPGKYGVFAESGPNSELRTDSVTFEIVDQDITGLLVKTYRGASVSGEVVFEGGNDKPGRGKPRQILLRALVMNEAVGNMGLSARIGPDGTFRVGGLPAGLLHFSIVLIEDGPMKSLSISRIERDGIILPRGFEIKDGEQITGLKLIVNMGTGTIRGVVKAQNGELPPRAHFSVWFTNTGVDPKSSMSNPAPMVDSRGRFVVEGLLPGTYEINAAVYVAGQNRSPSAKQQVTVTDGSTIEVTLTIDLSPHPEPR